MWFSTSAFATELCGTVTNVYSHGKKMVDFNLSYGKPTRSQGFTIKPDDMSRILPLVLTGMSNPNIQVCVDQTEELGEQFMIVSLAK